MLWYTKCTYCERVILDWPPFSLLVPAKSWNVLPRTADTRLRLCLLLSALRPLASSFSDAQLLSELTRHHKDMCLVPISKYKLRSRSALRMLNQMPTHSRIRPHITNLGFDPVIINCFFIVLQIVKFPPSILNADHKLTSHTLKHPSGSMVLHLRATGGFRCFAAHSAACYTSGQYEKSGDQLHQPLCCGRLTCFASSTVRRGGRGSWARRFPYGNNAQNPASAVEVLDRLTSL